MTTRTAVVCLCLGLGSFAASEGDPQKALPRIPNPEALSIEMAKALVSDDRERFTALAATREEMEGLLEKAQPPTSSQERRELKDKVAEILAERRKDFDRFQAMKRAAGFKQGATDRFELIEIDAIYRKDGMEKIRHSRVRAFQATEDGKGASFVIGLDDMFLFDRGWAFTSVSPGIGKETQK